MTKRNIHGDWTMSFEKRLFFSKIVGATNDEAAQSWFDEMIDIVMASEGGDRTPWVALVDGREWETASLDAMETNNELANWMFQHNCAQVITVYASRLQVFAAEKQLNRDGLIQFYFNYDEALQASFDKLSNLQGN
ncbi:hypothetical protein L4C34_10180 [Vibrio profundum]|uniref:hypothetical protein n=1 Tax=Vibrio profundum TaxID=2910247 RepID=UPI003D0B250C